MRIGVLRKDKDMINGWKKYMKGLLNEVVVINSILWAY